MVRDMGLVYTLSGLILFICTTSNASSMGVQCTSNKDCTSPLQCHPVFKQCVQEAPHPTTKKTSKPSPCSNCLPHQYCHPFFNMCLNYRTPPVVRNKRKPSAIADCQTDSDCSQGQYCHSQFKKCLVHLIIPTIPSTTSGTMPCTNHSQCTNQQYCHDFFKICLPRPTDLTTTTTTIAKPKSVCLNNSDCQTGHYCHSLAKTCLQMRSIDQSTMPSQSNKHGWCTRDSDCKITEYCGYHIKTSSVKARHRRKSRRPMGACMSKMVIFDPPFNCTTDRDCGKGRCCLKKLGVCRSNLKKGESCVTKRADFTCGCSSNMYCKPNSRARRIRGKRLWRKLKISKYLRHLLFSKGLLNQTKYTYGQCHHVTH